MVPPPIPPRQGVSQFFPWRGQEASQAIVDNNCQQPKPIRRSSWDIYSDLDTNSNRDNGGTTDAGPSSPVRRGVSPSSLPLTRLNLDNGTGTEQDGQFRQSDSTASRPDVSSGGMGLTSNRSYGDTRTNAHRDSNGKGKGRADETSRDELFYRPFLSEDPDLPGIMRLCEQELSEPYNLYTYRYFLVDWPHLTYMVFPDSASTEAIATIMCKQDIHRGKTNRGYIAMLSVDKQWRRRGIASKLVHMAIDEMIRRGAHEASSIVLETEYDNAPSIALYERLGFIREKRLHRFYSNGKDAFRLILPLPKRPGEVIPPETVEEAEEGRWAVGAGPDEGFPPIQEEDEVPEDPGPWYRQQQDEFRNPPFLPPPAIPPRASREDYDGMYT